MLSLLFSLSLSLSLSLSHRRTEFTEARLQKLGYPTFGDGEIEGDETGGSVVVEVNYAALGDERAESHLALVGALGTALAEELALERSGVLVVLQPWQAATASSFDTLVANDKHVQPWLRDNSWMQHLQLTRDEKHIIRHKGAVARVSTNLALLHEHKNRITGLLARLLVHKLISQWTGEQLLVLFIHDGSRRVWRAPTQHSDKFGSVRMPLSPR